MKDYFDLLALAREGAMDRPVPGAAVRATFGAGPNFTMGFPSG